MPGAVHQLRPSPAETAEPRKRIRTKISFHREKFSTILPDLGPLWRTHDRELWPDRAWGKLAPNIVQYLRLEAEGVLHIVTARAGRKLIGYCFELVVFDMHYSETRSSVNDLVFLHPDYRIGKRDDGLTLKHHPAMRLMREREKMLDDLGKPPNAPVARRRIDFKAWRNFGPALGALGYRVEAVRYQRVVTPTAEDED